METENTLLIEITQTQKDEYGMYSLIRGSSHEQRTFKPIVHKRREAKQQGEPKGKHI